MAKLHLHPVGVILLLLGFACWVLAMGGLAASTKFCNENNKSTVVSCANEYQQDWWTIFFELILLCVMLFTCFLNIFPKARYVYLSYLCMVTALLSFTTKKMYTKSFDLGVYDLSLRSRAFDAAGVGAMFLCMVNFSLIIFIGLGAAKALEAGSEPALGANVAFSAVSTAGPATGIGNTQMQQAGVPPAAPASF